MAAFVAAEQALDAALTEARRDFDTFWCPQPDNGDQRSISSRF